MYIFTSDYIQYIHVIECKNIHTVLLKLYNQFYMNILYEIVYKKCTHFYEEEIYGPYVRF